jgi:hypothetical protein
MTPGVQKQLRAIVLHCFGICDLGAVENKILEISVSFGRLRGMS